MSDEDAMHDNSDVKQEEEDDGSAVDDVDSHESNFDTEI